MTGNDKAFLEAQELAQAFRDHARETQMPIYADMMLRAAQELEGLRTGRENIAGSRTQAAFA